METIKDKIVGIIQSQPDDSSYDEIIREIAFGRMVDRGLKDSREDKSISNESMEHRIKSWQQ